MSAGKGPITLYFLFFKNLIAGIIEVTSSDFLRNSSLCGFKPKTAIIGFLFKTFL